LLDKNSVKALSIKGRTLYALPGNDYSNYNNGGTIQEMYTVDTTEYTSTNKIITIKGHNNMPYKITPLAYINNTETDFINSGIYQLYLKISGSDFDGIYPTKVKLTIKQNTGIDSISENSYRIQSTSGEINITDINNPINISIYNMDGNTLIENYHISTPSFKYGLTSGIYLIKINNKTTRIIVK
jgi:hypothetical protein